MDLSAQLSSNAKFLEDPVKNTLFVTKSMVTLEQSKADRLRGHLRDQGPWNMYTRSNLANEHMKSMKRNRQSGGIKMPAY